MDTNIVDIKAMSVKIVDIGERGEVDLDIGGVLACLIEPKPTLVYRGLVFLCSDDDYWEDRISAKLGNRICKGCTDDPRIVEIAKKAIEGKLREVDIGAVYPPLEESND